MTAIVVFALAALVVIAVAILAIRSPFDQRRLLWFAAAILYLTVPFFWPIGIYILVKLYRTRARHD